MATDDTNPFKAAVQQAQPLTFERCYAATVIEQDSTGLLTVRCDDPTIGEMAKVPLLVGTPYTRVVMPLGSRVRIIFAGGDPAAYFATAIEQDQTASKSVARVGDTGSGGTLTATSTPGGGPVTFTYIPPGGGPPVVGPTVNIGMLIQKGHPDVLLTSRGQ